MTTPLPDLDTLFANELTIQSEQAVRQSAAWATLLRLRLRNRMTVLEFLQILRRHEAVWAVVSTLSLRELASLILRIRATERLRAQDRTHLDLDEKQTLMRGVMQVLAAHPQGLDRRQCAHALILQGLLPRGVQHWELLKKLRQPLNRLRHSGQIVMLGTRSGARYALPAEPRQRHKGRSLDGKSRR